ncbi:hypothetical protein NPL7_03015 [Metamycoplasma hyosynoviae]|uniref:MSC_0622 family F1-like ATPase gamma subunit n=1 Tax=Metamycoplasma hyosynoviae TaxID=29559 RepID=UPI000460C017|nr:F0F1 ATP synthase subunit gamma [Metamycoplasma hyosynoviae]KDE41594.1 hypothetical protein NPL7_03015 [Metamycoplasma hyosynoviae]
MHIKKIEQKKQNLEHILLKTNSDKNILLITIMKLTSQLNFYIQNALLNKNLIDLVNEKYAINNKFVSHNKTLKFFRIKKQKELWIYLTEEQKYQTDSYSRYEKMILQKVAKKNVEFITVGNRAKQFCLEHKFEIIHSYDSTDAPLLANNLAEIIKVLYSENSYDNVHFVINTNKNYNESFNILPIQNLDIHKLAKSDTEQPTENVMEYQIFPNIDDFVNNEISIYLENVIWALIVESSFYNAKNGLVTINKIIKDIEEMVSKIKKKLLKIKRENEIEELVLLTKNNNSFDSQEGDSNG